MPQIIFPNRSFPLLSPSPSPFIFLIGFYILLLLLLLSLAFPLVFLSTLLSSLFFSLFNVRIRISINRIFDRSFGCKLSRRSSIYIKWTQISLNLFLLTFSFPRSSLRVGALTFHRPILLTSTTCSPFLILLFLYFLLLLHSWDAHTSLIRPSTFCKELFFSLRATSTTSFLLLSHLKVLLSLEPLI